MSGPSPTASSSTQKIGASQQSEVTFKRKRGVFHKDLQHMMYGFGDDANAHKAQEISSKWGKLQTEDFMFLIRKDPAKLNRCKDLLSMHEELKQARKTFDVDESKYAAAE